LITAATWISFSLGANQICDALIPDNLAKELGIGRMTLFRDVNYATRLNALPFEQKQTY
jgi:hypothetical protein